MDAPTPLFEDDEAEARALAVAIAEAEADPRRVSHEKVRAWLLRLAAGEFYLPPPEPGGDGGVDIVRAWHAAQDR